jgi:peptidyl-prolyl cis-trans isomerase A (cyclophilin A)
MRPAFVSLPVFSCVSALSVVLVAACEPPRVESVVLAPPPAPRALVEAPAPAKVAAPPPRTPRAPSEAELRTRERIVPSPDDPLGGKFFLADATQGLTGNGPLVATLTTRHGDLRCELYEDRAPVTVASFVGLARGLRPFKDPSSGTWVTRPLYDGTIFHRIIPGFMIQGGDPKGNGTGEPGFVLPDELWPGAKHDRAGLLCMANRGADTNGAQFFVTDASAPHLDKGYTIFGECGPVSVVHAIANEPVHGERPVTPIVIERVTITAE